ncbi:flagellar motor switch protein FliG [Candidatus Koribacter versatilis Ellin345]|uniref:Flagellar motor switch protein FliG n=1 Tax=Koribacter versatilis (strain Ellin345) TaxID=204669 RepID=Q1IR47_KORVE|nr:flagellar motor switch protein FliG [Candidatus Koribacter versatilis]ABF40653.1 flagellar motor switch protein FliG [Candidatus Koribacter versatilis Ellin345]
MTTPGKLRGVQKAAILMVVLGEEAAAAIYRHLSEQQIQRVTQEITDLQQVAPETVTAVLEEYYKLSATQEYLALGGTEYASKLLVKAFGPENAKLLLEQVSRAQEMSASKLDSLQKADPQQLAKFLEAEHPQTIALILAHLDVRQSTALLMKLPEKSRAEVVKRLAKLRAFSPEMAQKVALVLHKRLQSLGEQSRRAYAGFKGVADLLNQLDQGSVKTILESIEADDANLALSIRNLMFTFEDFLSVPEAGLRELLGQLDKKTLALALKGASEQLKAHVFKTMSSRAVEMLKEDMEVLGPVRSKDVTKAQQEVVAAARKLESEGKLVLKAEGEDEYVV